MTVLNKSWHITEHLDSERGEEAARLIWEDEPAAKTIIDPRTHAFARAMINASVGILKSSKGLIKKMMRRAAAGAEDLAVAQFQGIIEIIQNADDVRATEVRFSLRNIPDGRQLLIVHNGEPVTCHNVLGMALPYLTTKTERTDQRGRFGIGLKTLNRIADSIAIHSAPYHFSGDLLNFDWIQAEAAMPGFYDPVQDTMLVVHLNKAFEEDALHAWFETWHHDNLLFLASVSRFRWCEPDGKTRSERALSFSSWIDAEYTRHNPAIINLKSRRVDGPSVRWTIWQATFEVPSHLHPAHKARSETTDISVAFADGQTPPGLFIGFRTQVSISLPFSLDAQFDPSTSREALIENPWNDWLIDRSSEVVANIAAGLLALDPKTAWSLVPLKDDCVGEKNDPWLTGHFSNAFQKVRNWLGESAVLALPGAKPTLKEVVYEDETLSGLLNDADIEGMVKDRYALHDDARDNNGRWRKVMDALGVSTVVGTGELLESLGNGMFLDKPVKWWGEAGSRLVAHHPANELFNKAFLLSDRNMAVACEAANATDRPLVYDAAPSAFAARWSLLERLHSAYGESDSGKKVIAWLTSNAAFKIHLDAVTELAAFAEYFKGKKFEITDEELREMRDRFDDVPDSEAGRLGPKVGAVLLLDGYLYHSGKPLRQKVTLSESYLCKTIDGENATWSDAAGVTPNIPWIDAKYKAVLKTNVGRWAKRKRVDGSVSRGPHRFLTLLGAETAPRIMHSEERVRGGSPTRMTELRQRNAEQVEYDLLSPDLSHVLRSLQKISKRDTKKRSPALLRTLSRNWERIYAGLMSVPAQHVAIKYIYKRGDVTAAWLNDLRDTKWIAVGRGELVEPRFAVLRTPETQTIYQTFACDVLRKDVHDGLVAALHLITDVRIGDLLTRLEELRDCNKVMDSAQIFQIYRAIAKHCPKGATFSTRIGEITVQELRLRFLDGDGLIYIGDRNWRRPDQVMRGMDIFHGRRKFVPSGTLCDNLWVVLDVAEPNIDDCIQFCRDLAQEPYGANVEAALMDVYRYMEGLVDAAERKHRKKLRNLPLYCNGEWTSARPVFCVENTELRDELVGNVSSLRCWKPPCEVHDFPNLIGMLAIEILNPDLTVKKVGEEAFERGEQMRLRFCHAVDHLSAELARSAPAMRDMISVGWDQLKAIPLFVYENKIPVRANSTVLPPGGVLLSVKALVRKSPPSFYFHEDTIGSRDYGGRVLASFFPPGVRRRIDCEWALAWQKSCETAAEEIRLASDEKRAEAMQETATAINAGPKSKINITPPKSRNSAIKMRTLKESAGPVVGATVQQGKTQLKILTKPNGGKRGLKSSPPEIGNTNESANPVSATAYTNADLEQRGWEILVQALNTSPDQQLLDFRNRHGVGADGVFDWERFVEMKATARGPQTQVELSNNEFERAKQRGSDFILALVSGLENGYMYEVRLIFDPANCANVRPTNGVKLVALQDAPAVIIHFEESDEH
ncbi:MAG: DUF3883 domain-containing protein [Desulforhopalus sp.]|nr:DUF3883 domain-containing protein [Desulforhopalus sp.]